MNERHEDWKTGNGRTWYFDDALARKVVLDSPQAFLAYQAQQLMKMYHMTKHIVVYGDSVTELTLTDIETAKKAVVNLFVDEEINDTPDEEEE